MKPGRNREKKMRTKGLFLSAKFHACSKHRKIPEKPKGSRRDLVRDCGKEKRKDALNPELTETRE